MSKAYRKRHLKVKFRQILIYADGPQLILFDTATTSNFIAVAVEHEGFDYPFFGVEISNDMLAEYINQKFDLRFVFTNPTYKKWFLFDFGKVGTNFTTLKSIDISDKSFEQLIPDHGLFSRDHTESYALNTSHSMTVHKFDIDGTWDLPEFSKLYSQITDLYVMFTGVDTFLDHQNALDKRQKVQQAFVKPWEGGGSYGSFYNGLVSAQSRVDRLRVSGIQYNSPGYVNVQGRDKPFNEMFKLIHHIEDNRDELEKGYDRLYKTLKNHNLLTLKASRFDRKSDVAGLVSEEARKFATLLGAVKYENIYKMAGDDQLIAAKVLLSIYRRADRLYQFVLEGRVRLPA